MSREQDDEYGDEIVDLGGDVEPFSMDFNPYAATALS